MAEDALFVPTKHEHGDSGDHVDWDHDLFSFGCCKSHGCDDPGLSPDDIMRSSPGSGFEWKVGIPVASLRAIEALRDLLPAEMLNLNLRRIEIKEQFDNRDVWFAVGAATAVCS